MRSRGILTTTAVKNSGLNKQKKSSYTHLSIEARSADKNASAGGFFMSILLKHGLPGWQNNQKQ
jgi:hypothetical protein